MKQLSIIIGLILIIIGTSIYYYKEPVGADLTLDKPVEEIPIIVVTADKYPTVFNEAPMTDEDIAIVKDKTIYTKDEAKVLDDILKNKIPTVDISTTDPKVVSEIYTSIFKKQGKALDDNEKNLLKQIKKNSILLDNEK